MIKTDFKDKRVAVIGLGKEGLDLVWWLRTQGAEVTVLDKGTPKMLGVSYLQAQKLGAKFALGVHYLKDLKRFDAIFRSPGVPLDTPALVAVKKKVPISSAIRLFMERCPAKIVGITGTKGKSTTTALTYHLLKGNKRVYLAGNIGISPLQLLPKLKKNDVVILELSSFQLEDAKISPDIAVLLNVVPEHLDRHHTFAKYLKAKTNLYIHQDKNDWLIASQDFKVTREALKKSKAKKFMYSTRKVLIKGLYLAKDEIIYRQLISGKRRAIINRQDIRLLGEHNLQNILPAIAVALIYRVPLAHLIKKLKSFKSLPHRLELVREKDKVVFVNDSLGTVPEALAMAAKAFAYRDTVLISGGVYKGGDLEGMAKSLEADGVKLVVLIGQSTPMFAKALKKYAPHVGVGVCDSLKRAVRAAHNQVRERGGVVILAPGAASFDMFKNAYERGEKFKEIVKSL